MSMKKKFLALALAGMVAMPVVANATTVQPDKTVEGLISEAPTSDLVINGNVSTKDNAAPAGKIQVELPTAMSFTVDAQGQFSGPSNFIIKNSGSEKVKVDIINFSEGNPTGGIEIVEKSQLNSPSTKTRDKVSIVFLGESSKEVDLNTCKNNTEKNLFSVIPAKTTRTVGIVGKAGTSTSATLVEDNGATENFTVNFKISHVK